LDDPRPVATENWEAIMQEGPEGRCGGLTRRRVLGDAAGAAAAALAATFLPWNVRRALAEPALRGSLGDIKHVVLLMQENRSFDHYFGTMSGVCGFDDPAALKLPGGKSIFYQPDAQSPDGYLLPFHLNTRTTSAQKIPSTSHAWSVQHESWNGGKMDMWLPAHRKADGVNGPFVMGYHTRDDIPFQFALAEAFTICDAYHCSVFGPTWPNRLYWMTGTIDADGAHGGPVINNRLPESGPKAYAWTTYAERLEQAGVSWKVYQQNDNYGCNMLENFQAFRQAPEGSPLRVKGASVGAPDAFEHDAMNDRLPTVSWIICTSHESEHPDYMPAAGAAFVARKINAIASNPEVWAKTAFILNYDENDGLFDHVPPPTPPSGTPSEFVDGLPIGGGFRVPCIIVSPWTAGGWVCSEPFDHTSVLQFLEKLTGVEEPNITPWRRQTFGNLTSAFRFDESKAAAPQSLPDAAALLNRARAETALLPKPAPPSRAQSFPVQEEGRRNRRPPERS
jgi:phospholipase C